jgi:hypothetical protein
LHDYQKKNEKVRAFCNLRVAIKKDKSKAHVALKCGVDSFDDTSVDLHLEGALENWPNFQTPLLLMKLWDLLDNMCVVVDLKFEQKIPSGSASSSSKTR